MLNEQLVFINNLSEYQGPRYHRDSYTWRDMKAGNVFNLLEGFSERETVLALKEEARKNNSCYVFCDLSEEGCFLFGLN